MCEAEYMALAAAIQEIKFLRQLLKDMSGSNKDDSVVTLYVDNQSAIALAKIRFNIKGWSTLTSYIIL